MEIFTYYRCSADVFSHIFFLKYKCKLKGFKLFVCVCESPVKCLNLLAGIYEIRYEGCHQMSPSSGPFNFLQLIITTGAVWNCKAIAKLAPSDIRSWIVNWNRALKEPVWGRAAGKTAGFWLLEGARVFLYSTNVHTGSGVHSAS
jgi:hypothetical protein